MNLKDLKEKLNSMTDKQLEDIKYICTTKDEGRYDLFSNKNIDIYKFTGVQIGEDCIIFRINN